MILVYNMSVLQLLNKTTNSIDKLYRKFWWGEKEDKNKFHTIKWSEICKPIDEGGLGIRDSRSNNIALLSKTGWRYMNEENLLCSKVLKAKYCLESSLWEAKAREGNSWFGKGFVEGVNFIKENDR